MSDSYSDQLVVALRLRDVPGQRIGQVVAEIEAYTADSGQDPVEAFGPVEAYSAAIAAELRHEPKARRRTRELLSAYPPAVGSLVLVDGLWGVVKGSPAELTVGEAAFATALPLAGLLLIAAVLRAGSWAYVTTALTAVAGGALLWAGNGLVLVRYPAWAGLVCGTALLVGGLSIVTIVGWDPVIDPRSGRDRHPTSLRFVALAAGPMVVALILVVLVAVLTD